MQEKPVRGGEHDLEEYEQVEQVARQEGAVDAHQQELKKTMKMGAGRVPAREREDQRSTGQDGRQQDHHCRQSVQHQNDPNGRRPVSEQIDGGCRGVGLTQQRDRNVEGRQRGQEVDHPLQKLPPLVVDRQQRARHERECDGSDDKMVCPPVHHGSCPSTWSVPDKPREASRTTRKRAVVAKPMTMAVKTSA